VTQKVPVRMANDDCYDRRRLVSPGMRMDGGGTSTADCPEVVNFLDLIAKHWGEVSLGEFPLEPTSSGGVWRWQANDKTEMASQGRVEGQKSLVGSPLFPPDYSVVEEGKGRWMINFSKDRRNEIREDN